MTKPDPAVLGPIDARITRELPNWQLDEGVAYWRWAYTTEYICEDSVLPTLIWKHGAVGGFSGIVLGKP